MGCKRAQPEPVKLWTLIPIPGCVERVSSFKKNGEIGKTPFIVY